MNKLCALLAAALAAGALVGCAGSGASSEDGENRIYHEVSAADKEAAESDAPVKGNSAVLWVNGLGCPQCASNIDLQLKRIKSVETVHTDLSNGKVHVTFKEGRAQRPSPRALGDAAEDAGFTLVKIEAEY
ncbi:MAG TPA: heavy-metal-associated domain-containing protein [Phycisphaerales bacterium]|nr:heavy-metal-associated domain-containing protein [Phycisphaerales bacterium]